MLIHGNEISRRSGVGKFLSSIGGTAYPYVADHSPVAARFFKNAAVHFEDLTNTCATRGVSYAPSTGLTTNSDVRYTPSNRPVYVALTGDPGAIAGSSAK